MSQEERSGWRDQRISDRHRKWGVDCPGADLDFVLIEYDHSIPRAVIEYKHELFKRSEVDPENPNIKAIVALSNAAHIPFFVTVYNDELTLFTVTPMNELAKLYFPVGTERLSEAEYVAVLYAIRDRRMPADIRKLTQDHYKENGKEVIAKLKQELAEVPF